MKRLIYFIQKKRKLALWLSIVFFLIMTGIMVDSGKCLKTPHAPRRIISLELTFKKEKADRIKKEWNTIRCLDGKIIPTREILSSATSQPEPVIDTAITHTLWDFPFILAYTFLLIVLVLWKNIPATDGSLSAKTVFNLRLAIIALAGDTIENIFMLLYLNDFSVHPVTFAVPATIKFIALLIIIGYILSQYMKMASGFVEGFITTLWNNRVSLVGLFVIYFSLWKSDQGQDLLLNLNVHGIGPALFYTVLTVLAAMNWFLPKYYTKDFIDKIPANNGIRILFQNPSRLVKGNETNVPRVLGILTFLIPACAILNALDFMQIEYFFNFISPTFLLLATTALYIWIIHEDYIDIAFHNLQARGKGWIFFAVIFTMLAIILLFGFINKGAPYQLANLSIGLFMMSFIFCIVTTLRVYPKFYQVKGLKKLLNWFHERWASRWVNWAALICIAIFLTVNLIPVIFSSWTYARFITLPVVFTGIAFYTVFFFVLLILGKYSGINWAAIVIVIGLLMAVFFDNRFHDIYRVDRTSEAAKVQTLEQHISGWIAERKEEIVKEDKPYPVFIVNTYGGGIRAAAWTSLVVSYLDSVTEGKFQRHVFAYSGASGGTIGASVMCALRKSKKGEAVNPQQVVNFYKNDFLTPVLVGLIGRDVFFSTTGWDAIDDRSRLQDNTWETHLASLDGGAYAKEFCSLWYDGDRPQYDVPLLFANTYHVESGLKGIIAPVKLSARHFPQAVDVNEKLGESGLPFSTASFLSARFPYISPAGKLDDEHHFLDGGLKENSGAETAFELYTLVKERIDLKEADSAFRASDPVLALAYKKIHVYFLSLNNTGNYDPEVTTKNLVEFTAPVTALYNNWVGNTLKADSVLGAQMKRDYFQLRPMKDTIWHEGLPFRPVLPLGWQISDFALQRLNESLTYCNKSHHKGNRSNPEKINRILKLIGDFSIPHQCNKH